MKSRRSVTLSRRAGEGRGADLYVLVRCFLMAVLLSPALAQSAADAQLDEQEMRQCSEQLRRIHEGIVRYHDEHQRLPHFLSDLLEKYCRREDLSCPAKKRVGALDWARQRLLNEALMDPKDDNFTYSYEFIEKLWRHTTITYREYKNAQRDYLDLRDGSGASVPLVRCFLHGREKVLNVTYSGKITKSGIEWEDDTGHPHRELTPESLLPRVEVALQGVLPPRPPDAGRDLVDLALYYNATIDTAWYRFPVVPEGSFEQLLYSPRFIKDARFDARGVIQLKGAALNRPFPLRSEGIRVGQTVRRLHWLMGVSGTAPSGARIAQFQLNYRTESPVVLDIYYGQDVIDWHTDPATADSTEIQSNLAWTGESQSKAGRREPIWLYRVQRPNPHPDKEIISLDFAVTVEEGALSPAAPALFAVTLER